MSDLAAVRIHQAIIILGIWLAVGLTKWYALTAYALLVTTCLLVIQVIEERA